mgnify:CR=1 FL=1
MGIKHKNIMQETFGSNEPMKQSILRLGTDFWKKNSSQLYSTYQETSSVEDWDAYIDSCECGLYCLDNEKL